MGLIWWSKWRQSEESVVQIGSSGDRHNHCIRNGNAHPFNAQWSDGTSSHADALFLKALHIATGAKHRETRFIGRLIESSIGGTADKWTNALSYTVCSVYKCNRWQTDYHSSAFSRFIAAVDKNF